MTTVAETLYCENKKSSHNLLHCRQRKTEQQPQRQHNEDFMQSGVSQMARRRVLDRLQTPEQVVRDTVKQRITVVEATRHERM